MLQQDANQKGIQFHHELLIMIFTLVAYHFFLLSDCIPHVVFERFIDCVKKYDGLEALLFK